jgi:hypothetical protein
VKRTWLLSLKNNRKVEDTIQNGVKDTVSCSFSLMVCVEDTIQNGVKDTISQYQHHHRGVENTLQNGVKI